MLKKVLVGLVMLVLGVCLMACGSDKEEDKADKSNKDDKAAEKSDETVTEESTPEEEKLAIASTETWGDFTVGIPTDWTFRKGDTFDENDTRYCSVKKSDFKYFDLKMEEEQVANNQYNYNKNTYTNEQEDVSGKYGDIEWTGFQYSDGWGGYGFELIATVNEKPVRVSSCGFKFDSEEAQLVLNSLVIK